MLQHANYQCPSTNNRRPIPCRLTVVYLFLFKLSRIYVRFMGRLMKSKYRAGALFFLITVLKGLPQPAHFMAVSLEISGLTAALISARSGDVTSSSTGLARFALWKGIIRRSTGK